MSLKRDKFGCFSSRETKRIWRRAIDCIALNDEPTMMDPEQMAGQISIGVIAEAFGVTDEVVINEVISVRKRVYG